MNLMFSLPLFSYRKVKLSNIKIVILLLDRHFNTVHYRKRAQLYYRNTIKSDNMDNKTEPDVSSVASVVLYPECFHTKEYYKHRKHDYVRW